MDKNDFRRLRHILVYCNDISAFVVRFGNDRRVFENDRAFADAAAMCVLQIGELAKGLSDEFCRTTEDRVPWRMIRGMRNWIAHAYAEIDTEVLWETIIHDIPRLASFCEEQLGAADAGQSSPD